MDLNGVADDEFHAGKADTVGWKSPPAKGRRRIGEIEHDMRAGGWQPVDIDLLGASNSAGALIDEAVVTLGTGDGDVLAGM